MPVPSFPQILKVPVNIRVESLKIIVADAEPAVRRSYQDLLAHWGHQVIAAQSGRQLVELCQQFHPDLMITDIHLADMDGIEAAHQVALHCPTPVILVGARHDSGLLRRAFEEHVYAYLVKPPQPGDLQSAILLALRRFTECRELRRESAELRQALADRKLIERVKGLVMQVAGVTEEEAWWRLNQFARDRNLKAAVAAGKILEVGKLFRPAEGPRVENQGQQP